MKTWALLLATGAVALGSGCADNDYDLSDVDLTVGIGGDSLVLPVSSTESIMLDDVLELNNSDIVKIQANGDYVISKVGGYIEPSHPCVSKVHITKRSTESEHLYVDVNSFASARRRAGSRIQIAEQTVEGVVTKFKYSGDAPYEIKDLQEADVDAKVSIKVQVSPVLKNCVPHFTTMKVDLPDFMTMKVNSASPSSYESDGHSLTFHNVSTSDAITIDATLTKLDFHAGNTEGNKLEFKDGVVTMDGVVSVSLSVSEFNVPTSPVSASDCYVYCQMTMEALTVSGATGKFAPSIDLTDLGEIEINNVPDFLKGNDVHVALHNPTISLKLSNDMNLAGKISGTINSVDDNGTLIASVDVPEMTVNPNGTTNICICKYATDEDRRNYDGVYEVSNLSDVIDRVPHRIFFKVKAAADSTKVSSIELGKKYTIAPSYTFQAPLAFDEGAEIVYRDTVDGWHDDIEDIDLMDGAYITATANIDNKVPVYLKVSAFAIDENGREISSNRISVTVDRTVRPSADGVTAVTTPVVVTVKELEKGALKTSDGLILKAEAMSGEEGSQSIVGKTINAYNQTLQVRDIKIKVIGKIIADLND